MCRNQNFSFSPLIRLSSEILHLTDHSTIHPAVKAEHLEVVFYYSLFLIYHIQSFTCAVSFILKMYPGAFLRCGSGPLHSLDVQPIPG